MSRFRCALPGKRIAERLAHAIYEDGLTNLGVPFRGSGPWWELSLANDHKLDDARDGAWTYRERHEEPARMARVRTVIAEMGGEVVS